MSTEARAALADFVAALERHLEVSLGRRDEDDPQLREAYQQVADAFEAYEETLVEVCGEVTPLDVYTGDDDDEYEDDDFEDDEDDDDRDDEDDDDRA